MSGFSLEPETTPNLFTLLDLENRMSSTFADVRDRLALRTYVERHQPEFVFHLASQALVARGYAEPALTYETNVMGLVYLLEAIRSTPGVRAVIVVTSDKCYENNEWLWAYRETEPLGGRDPYSNSKACAELLVRGYRDSFFRGPDGPALATARAGNVIGGGDWSQDRLVPDIINAIASGQSAQLRQPEAMRPWQHVFEALSGYLLLAERLLGDPAKFADAWNFGPLDADSRTVGELADALLVAAGQTATWHRTGATQLHEAHRLRVDSSKAQGMLGWRPRLDIDQALQLTANWYTAWLRGECMLDVSEQQLAQYRAA